VVGGGRRSPQKKTTVRREDLARPKQKPYWGSVIRTEKTENRWKRGGKKSDRTTTQGDKGRSKYKKKPNPSSREKKSTQKIEGWIIKDITSRRNEHQYEKGAQKQSQTSGQKQNKPEKM